jgi:hypothetical protein
MRAAHGRRPCVHGLWRELCGRAGLASVDAVRGASPCTQPTLLAHGCARMGPRPCPRPIARAHGRAPMAARLWPPAPMASVAHGPASPSRAGQPPTCSRVLSRLTANPRACVAGAHRCGGYARSPWPAVMRAWPMARAMRACWSRRRRCGAWRLALHAADAPRAWVRAHGPGPMAPRPCPRAYSPHRVWRCAHGPAP